MTSSLTSEARNLASDPVPKRCDQLTIPRRVQRKIERVFGRMRGAFKRRLVKALFSLPGLTSRNPRRRITSFRDYCLTRNESPPAAGEPFRDFYIKIHERETLERTRSTAVNSAQASAFEAGALKYQEGLRTELPEVFLAGVRNPKIYSRDFLLLTPDNRIFFESALSRSDYLEANGILDTLMLPDAQPLPGRYCLLANRSVGAYYHWLIDVLPKLSLIDRFSGLEAIPLILPGKLHSFHHQSLAMLGIPSSRVVTLNPGCWQPDEVVYPEILGPTGIPSPHAVAWLRDRFLTYSGTGSYRGARRIYLTRRDATQRRVLNEADVIAELLPLGFEILCPGDLTFPQQIEAFREVEIVIAPHGAGLTNMVFAPPGALMIEFFGDNYINGCFWALANLCRQEHAFLIGPSQWLDYTISTSELRVLLTRLGISPTSR